MAASKLRLTGFKLFQRYNICDSYTLVLKSQYCTTKSKKPTEKKPKRREATGFAELNERFSNNTATIKYSVPVTDKNESGFAELNRKQTGFLEKLEASEDTSVPIRDENKLEFAKVDEKQTEMLDKKKETSDEIESTKENKSGFAKFDVKQTDFLGKLETLEDQENLGSKEPKKPTESFLSLLRNSPFIDLGDPVGKQVIGEIYHVVGKDLYIDFGWKFPTVCKIPEKNQNLYVAGAKVRLLIKDLELASKFLGGDEEITLKEADCVLLGLLNKPKTKEPLQ